MCFQAELAHWFYVDFYCGGNRSKKCPDVSLRDFIRQIFHHCDFLTKYADNIDKVIDDWRKYKSSVPTYGAALLDSSMNHVLLVQGYYSKSWGFPKGKVNEGEESVACATREVEEEVGYDITDKVCETRLIQNFVNETLVRLYIIKDVPADFAFAPTTRKEIGKIQWFSIWDLPKDRSDVTSCERIGKSPNSFYTAIPFIKELQAYVSREQSLLCEVENKQSDALQIGGRSHSAFSPVNPENTNTKKSPAKNRRRNENKKSPISQNLGHAIPNQQSSPKSPFFKPVVASHEVSYTGSTFVQMFSESVSSVVVEECLKVSDVTRPVPTVPKRKIPILGRPVYDVCKSPKNKKNLSQMKGKNGQEFDGVWLGRASYTPSKLEITKSGVPVVEESKKTNSIKINNIHSDGMTIVLCKAWSNFRFDGSQWLSYVIDA